MRRKSYMFTNKSHSDRGKASAALGIISFVSVCLVIYISYSEEGAMNPKLGAAAVFALLFSLIGEVLGIISRVEKDKFYFFPNVGLVLNALVIAFVGFILYLGVNGI